MRLSLTLTLPTHDLVLWTDGSVPFPLGQGGSGVLAETTLSFSAGPVCSSFSAEACAILQALLVSAAPTSLPLLFSLCDSRSVLSSVFPFTSNSLANLAGTVFSLPLFYQAIMVPGHSFLLGNNAVEELARREPLLVPSAIPCSLSPLISRFHSCLFSG